jgi:hypothetical protein
MLRRGIDGTCVRTARSSDASTRPQCLIRTESYKVRVHTAHVLHEGRRDLVGNAHLKSSHLCSALVVGLIRSQPGRTRWLFRFNPDQLHNIRGTTPEPTCAGSSIFPALCRREPPDGVSILVFGPIFRVVSGFSSSEFFLVFEPQIRAALVELGKMLEITNCIENLMRDIEVYTRNVKRWFRSLQRHQWVVVSLMESEERFRRIRRST